MSSPPIRTILIDDDDGLAPELARLMLQTADLRLVASFCDAESAITALGGPELQFDVALVDLGLPRMGGIELLREITRLRPKAEKVVFTVCSDDASVFDALQAGATGYILKSAEPHRLLASIAEVAEGGASMSPGIARRVLQQFRKKPSSHANDLSPPSSGAALTPREVEVLTLLARGYTYIMIARTLEIAIGTLQGYIKAIYRKLEIGSKAEATAEAYRRGLLR